MNGRRLFTPMVRRKILQSCKLKLERERLNKPPNMEEVKRLELIIKKTERALERSKVYVDAFGNPYEVKSSYERVKSEII